MDPLDIDYRDDLRDTDDSDDEPGGGPSRGRRDNPRRRPPPYQLDDRDDTQSEFHAISVPKPEPKIERKEKFGMREDYRIDEPTPLEMTNLVIEYLVIEGYPEAAKALAAEAQVRLLPSDWMDIEKRVEIKRHIVAGDIGVAIDKLNAMCPGMMESDTSVRFDLCLQRFLELIREDDIFSALEWSQEKLSNEDLNDEQMARLEQACTLAAFNDPNDCKYAELLDQGHREAVAETVNGAILSSQGRPKTSRVETMFKMKMFMSLNLPMPNGVGQEEEELMATNVNREVMNGV